MAIDFHKANKALTAKIVRDRLDYNPLTGEFTWRKARTNWVGKKAGSLKSTGYISIRLFGRLWKAHRLAWLHYYGKHPRHTVDHINFDRTDNRIANLRDVWASENSARRENYSPRGNIRAVKSGRFRVQIRTPGKLHYLGTFVTKAQAESAVATFTAGGA